MCIFILHKGKVDGKDEVILNQWEKIRGYEKTNEYRNNEIITIEKRHK